MAKTRAQSLVLKDICTHLRVPDARKGKAKTLLMFLGNVSGNAGRSWYSVRAIKRSTGMGLTSVLDSTEYLVSIGWLKCEKGSYSRSNRYELVGEVLIKALQLQREQDAKNDGGVPETDIEAKMEGVPETDISVLDTDKGVPETDMGVPESVTELVITATVQETRQQAPVQTLQSTSSHLVTEHSSVLVSSNPTPTRCEAPPPTAEGGELYTVELEALYAEEAVNV